MGIGVNVVDPLGVERGGPTNNTVDLVSLFEQKLGEIRSILTSDTSDKCAFHFMGTLRLAQL